MISFQACPDLSAIREMKAQYLASLVAPMDGMWDTGFTNAAPHFEINENGESAGYYAVDEAGGLLQFYVRPVFVKIASQLFESVISQDSVSHAIVGTIDPLPLSLCLDLQKKVQVHTYLYERQIETSFAHPEAEGLNFRPVAGSELERTVEFQQLCLGGKDDLSGWLTGYSQNLIKREELYVLCGARDWVGLGEYRKSDTQEGVVDLGMMVAPPFRGAGWASYVLSLLSKRSVENGHRAICSTTAENVAAQKAILRAGFVSRHRILNVTF